MSDTTKKPPDPKAQRKARLEQALRENLKKRKALARKKVSSTTSSAAAASADKAPNATED